MCELDFGFESTHVLLIIFITLIILCQVSSFSNLIFEQFQYFIEQLIKKNKEKHFLNAISLHFFFIIFK